MNTREWSLVWTLVWTSTMMIVFVSCCLWEWDQAMFYLSLLVQLAMWSGSPNCKCPINHISLYCPLKLVRFHHITIEVTEENNITWNHIYSVKDWTQFEFPLTFWDIRRFVYASKSKPWSIYFDFQHHGFDAKTRQVHIEMCDYMKANVISYKNH